MTKPAKKAAPELPSRARAQEWPADKVERRSVDSLTPYARNARTHSDEQVAQIAASIKEWGWTIPVLVDEDGGLIAGHGRVMAARKLGLKEIPVMVARGWTEAQKRAYVLADNQLALNAGWNNDLLKVELSDLQGLDFDLGLLGFDEKVLDGLLAPEGTEGLTDPDEVPETPAHPITMPGDVWILGRHRITCGDSTNATDVERVLAGVKPHLMVTDPPYGVEYNPAWRETAKNADGTKFSTGKHATGKVLNDGRADWREAWALFPGDVAYVWCASLQNHVVAESLLASTFALRTQIIWRKSNFAIGRGDYHWQHEPCWYAVKNGGKSSWNGARDQSSIWDIPMMHRTQGSVDDGKTVHGTQKPVECMKRPIENNSSPGQAVYEPFSGSGTTIIAAEQTGRCCYAVELNPAYVDVAVTRWEKFTGQHATLESNGRTFAEMLAQRGEPGAVQAKVAEPAKKKAGGRG